MIQQRTLLKYISVLMLSVFVVSCKKLDKLVSFNLDTINDVTWLMVDNEVLTDTFPDNEKFTLVSETYNFNDNKKFSTNKSTPQSVEDVEAYFFTMAIDSGAGNFSFMKDLTVYISSPGNLYEDMKLADVPFPQADANFMTFDIPKRSEGWLSIIQRNEYRFRTDFTLISPMPDTVHLKYKMSFRLKAMPND